MTVRHTYGLFGKGGGFTVAKRLVFTQSLLCIKAVSSQSHLGRHKQSGKRVHPCWTRSLFKVNLQCID